MPYHQGKRGKRGHVTYLPIKRLFISFMGRVHERAQLKNWSTYLRFLAYPSNHRINCHCNAEGDQFLFLIKINILHLRPKPNLPLLNINYSNSCSFTFLYFAHINRNVGIEKYHPPNHISRRSGYHWSRGTWTTNWWHPSYWSE